MEQDQVDATVDQLAENIAGMMDNTAPTESATTEQPEAEQLEQKVEPVETKEPEKKPESPQKRKIKWQGQEVEIEPDKEVELLQKGFDYTRKTQELSQRLNEIAPIEGLAKRIKDDPNLAKHIAGYFNQEQKAPSFDDPIEELKYNIKQETIREVKENLIAPLQHQAQQISQQTVIDRTLAQVSTDPMYKDVMSAMRGYVESLPPALSAITFQKLDSDPQAFLETYGHYRKQIEKTKPTNVEPPQPSKREERAPILEAAGKAQETSGDPKKTEKVAKLKAKALRGGDPAALADWLLQGGHVDHLF